MGQRWGGKVGGGCDVAGLGEDSWAAVVRLCGCY